MRKASIIRAQIGILFVPLFLFIVCCIVSVLYSCQSLETKHTQAPKTPKNEFIRPSGVPAMAFTVADYIEQNHAAPDGFIGGREFENRESLLPYKDDSQQAIIYHEYDIYPKVKGKNRGPERIILGSDKSRYYTANHYQSFIKF